MATICRIKSNNSEIKQFLNSWIGPLSENLDTSRDQFLASVQENFNGNQLGLKLLQKRLDQSNININVLDLIPENQHQTHEKFRDWELKSSESEISIFGTNTGLNRFIKHKFAVDAYKYCIVDTTKGNTSPLVESKEQLIENIAKFKQDLIQRLLPYAVHYNPELQDYIGEIVFNSEFGADGDVYDKVMNSMKKCLDELEIDLNTIDVTDPEYKEISEIVYNIFSLINFDYLLDESMKGIIEKSPKSIYGDLNRTEYNLMLTPESDQQDLQGISDQQYENALNYITPDINKIVSAIPIVRYSLKGKNERFKLSESGATLQLPHILQLSHWLQLYLPQLQELFKLEGLDFQSRPVYTVKTILKALHDNIANYSYDKTPLEIKRFLKTKNIRSAIQTGISIYEYLFNDENRINPFTVSIQEINWKYNGTPRFNIINELCQQLIQTAAPAFIEHTKIGTIFNENRQLEDSIGDNFIQRFEHSKTRFSFLNPMTKCLITEGLKEKSDIADILIKYSGKSLSESLESSKYLSAIKKILGIKDSDNDTIKSLLIEANSDGKLKALFDSLGDNIKSIKPQSDVFKYWKQASNIITIITRNLNYDTIGMVLGPLLDSTPSPTFMSREGNQLGVYRTTSLVFMFDHLRKRYKSPSNEEKQIIQTESDYKPLRQRCNFFVDNPQVLAPGDNSNYLSTVAIPLTMGDEEINLEARKQPEFIQDLHAFIGEYMSLMLGVKQKQATPMLAFQLGTYSDKMTLPQLCINAKPTLIQYKSAGGRINRITLENLLKERSLIDGKLSNNSPLLRYTYAYSAVNSLDMVNHIIEDWKEIFRRLIQNQIAYKGNKETSNFINLALDENSELRSLIDSLLALPNISQELISKEYSDKFVDAITYLNRNEKFTPFEYETTQLKTILDKNIEILNKILQNLPKKFLTEAIPQLAQENKQLNLKGLKIVDIQYADKYENGYELNRMIIDDLNRNCSFKTYRDYCAKMANSGLNKKYYINGELKSFEDYLIDYFTYNTVQINKMIGIGKQNDVSERPSIFSDLYTNGKINQQQLERIYHQYIVLTNFLRHQALDLSVKEAYEDKAKNKTRIDLERSDRQQTTTKRNNTLTATIIPFLMDIVNGVSRKTKICVIEDIGGGVFNTIGIDREVDEFDGLGFNSPIQVRMEDTSLCKKHRISTKKTFITPVNDYSAEELKWASNEITNKKIRESQGCQRNLLSVFRRMHNIPFDYDITRHWQTGSESIPIVIGSFLGKQLYSREGFDYYRYDSIENIGKDTYVISKTKVDPKTGESISDPIKSDPIKINTIYDIYEAFNGINCKELTNEGLVDSENIMDFLYKLVWNVGEFIDPENAEDIDQTNIKQPLRDSFIGILATHSSNKRGASNIVTGNAWVNDNIPLSYTEIEIATGGEQLSAEHAADGSSITKGTQLMQDIAQKGYTSELVENVYNAIARVMDQSSPDFDEIVELLKQENITGIQEKISEKIVKQLEITGTSEELQNLIAEFKRESEELGEPFILPLSMLVREVIKSYAPDLNKNVIKQKDSGLMGTLTGSSGFVQTYNIGDNSYTMGDFLTDKFLDKFKGYRITIDKFCAKTQIPFNEVIRCLSLLDLLGDLDSARNYFMKSKEAVYEKEDDPHIQKWLEVALNTLIDINKRRVIAQTYFSVNPDVIHFLGFEKILISEVKPGETIINPNTYESVLIDSSKSILDLKESIESNGIKYVMLDKMTPVDLQPSITSIETELGYKENEYTSFEAILGSRINRYESDLKLLNKNSIFSEDTFKQVINILNVKLKDEKNEYLRDKIRKEIEDITNSYNRIYSSKEDEYILVSLLDYLSNFQPEYRFVSNRIKSKQLTDTDFKELRQIQEDIQNFKNHVKAFGYTLQMPENGDLTEYFGGFNPREHFESQLQAKIIEEDLYPQIENGVLLDPKISNDEIRKALQFYYETQADENKKKSIALILTDEQAFENFIKEHPQFLFKILPYKKSVRYKEFFDSKPQFDKIIKSNVSAAKIIMPAIYRGQMKLGNMDLVDIDFDFFKKAPTFYKVDPNLINKDGSMNVDFIIRTFRGQENIVVADDLTDPELDKYGQTIPNQNIIIDEEGYRINPRTKEKLYKLPSNHQYIIKRNGKTETIILKNNQNVYSDIEQMLVSDEALVSVQPFISNLIEIGDKGKTRHLLRTLNGINTIPSFERMYKKLDDFLSRSNLKPLISQLRIELGQDYIDTQEDYEDKYRNSMFISFLRSLDVIATRIPTQNMSSIMTMKVAAFTKSNINDVFVTKWQQWLQGADYDIDKAFILGYNFDEYGRFITWSPLQLTYDEDLFERSMRIPLPSGKTSENGYVFEISDIGKDPLMDRLVYEYIAIQNILYNSKNYGQSVQQIADEYGINLTGNSELDFQKLKLEILINILNRVNQVNGFYISDEYNGSQYVIDLVNQINIHNSAKRSDVGYKNYATYQMHRIMNDPRNATTAYKSIDIATDAFNNPIKKITESEQIIYNLDDGHTISSITVSGAVGKDDVGIGANGTKAQFTILNYLNREFDVNEPLTKDELKNSHYFNIIKLDLEYEDKGEIIHWKSNVGPISDTIIPNGVRQLYEQFLNGNQLYLYNRDASQDVGALLSMAADNAKTLNLDKMHAETDYFAMHIFLAMIGCPPPVIIKYFRSPIFMEVIHRAQNDLAKGNVPLITYDTFIKIANEYKDKPEYSSFIQLAEIFACAKELTAFAQILSINQGIKVEEQELVGQKQKLEKAYHDALSQRGIFSQDKLMTQDGYFNDQALDAINNRFIQFGSISIDLIQYRMQRANESMQRAGITLKDPFNLNRFKHDEVYAEAIKCVFDVVKHNYNIFDIIDKAPHFSKMLEKYNQLMQVYSAGNAIINYEVNQAPIDYDKNILVIEKGDPLNGEFGDNIVLPETYTKKQTSAAKTACIITMFQNFLKEVASNSEFKYTRKINKDLISMKCNFTSDNDLHSFIDFVNLVLIPKLFEQNPDNKFLEGLEINNQEAETNNNIFFSFGENLRILQNAEMSGITRLHQIKQAFKEIKNIKLTDLFKGENFEILDPNTTVGDFLFIYNTIMKLVNPSGYDFGSLFTEFSPEDMKTMYYKFTRDYDTGKKKLNVDKHLLMACIVRNQIKMNKDGIKQVVFTDSAPIILSKFKDGKYSTSLVLGMPEKNSIDSYIELTDIFKDAILSKKLQFTEINPNCE